MIRNYLKGLRTAKATKLGSNLINRAPITPKIVTKKSNTFQPDAKYTLLPKANILIIPSSVKTSNRFN